MSDEDYNNLREYFDQEVKYTNLLNPSNKISINDKLDTIFNKLAITCAGRICGVDAVIGAQAAQEVIKSLSIMHTPIKQFLHFEALSILPDSYVEHKLANEELYATQNNRYDGQTIIFGKEYMDIMRQYKDVFIVGAGAIGSDHLKNFVMMGVNKITITDMDHIENSNLNRQFLFRREDIGQSKSVVAAKKAKLINPDVEIIAHEYRVGKDTEHIYDWTFFQELSVVANALDNIEARKFVDTLCVKYNKPMLESGTLGTKGSIQTVIPYLTESYSSLQDPPEQHIPMCTIKLFPYKFEHTVQHARDIFEGYFNRIPASYDSWARDSEARETSDRKNITELKQIYEDIVLLSKGCLNFKCCINVAYKQWYKLFHDSIVQLISDHPEDESDDGIPFWSGDKIFPKVVTFDPENSLHMDFIIYFSHVWADMMGIPADKRYPIERVDKFNKFIQRLMEKPYQPFDTTIDSEDKDIIIDKINMLIKENQEYFKQIKKISFEKDDASNHHIDIISTCANTRAISYNIEQKDKLTVKGIAGKIIPAIATTTSVVSGLISLEMYKIFYCNMMMFTNSTEELKSYQTIQRFRYGSFNLASQIFGFSESYPVKKMRINGKTHTIWTKYPVHPDTTLQELIEQWENVEVKREINGVKSKKIMSLDCIADKTKIICNEIMSEIDDETEALKIQEFKQQPLRDIINSSDTYDLTLCLEELLTEEDEEEEGKEKEIMMIDVTVCFSEEAQMSYGIAKDSGLAQI